MAVDKKISELTLATPDLTDVIPFVDVSDTTMGLSGTTKKATKADLKGDTGDNATIDVGTTTTLVPGASATVTNVGTTSDAIIDFGIPAGSVIHSTVGIPNVSVGVNGDWAFDTSSNSYVYFKSAGAWALVNSNKGAKGDTGDNATATAGTTTTGAPGTNASVVNSGTTSDAIFDFTIPRGDTGATGREYAWKGTWVGGTAYVVDDIVNYLGSGYICILATSSELPTNATYWGLFVQGSSGDVVGPLSAVDSNFASFDTTTGKLIKDSGAKIADFATAAHNHSGVYAPVLGTDDNYVTDAEKAALSTFAIAPAANTDSYIPQWDGANSKLLKDGLAVPAGGLAGITALNAKQDTLVSGTNIKTVGGVTLLGSGDLGQIDSDYINIQLDGGSPTLNTLSEYITTTGSSGVSDGTITYVTVGTSANKVSVAGGEGYIRITNDEQGELQSCKWAASPDVYTFSAPAAGFENTIFIGIEYSGGATTVVTKAAITDWNWYTNFPLARCAWDGTTMHLVNAYAHAEDTANHTRQYLRKVFGFTRENSPEGSGGLELSVSLRALAMTAGKVWMGFNNYTFDAVASGSAFDTYYKKAGGGFVETTGVTSYPNTQYDNGSGTLQNLTANRYGTLWIYAGVGETVLHCVYGAVNATTVVLAQADTAPTLPEHLTYGGILIGRIIFKNGDPSPTLVESAWTNTFSATAVGDHNQLTSLQGGTAGEYYHLTSAEYTGLSGLTASEIVISNASGDLASAPVATYPSLAELAYVKGVTSAIQTQINAKGAGTVTAVSVATANGVSGTSSGGATPALTIALGAITPTTVNGLLVNLGTNSIAANTAIGELALDDNNSGTGGNTAIGNSALTANTTGNRNVAIGRYSMMTNIGGNVNTAIGTDSLKLNESGSSNIAVGYNTLSSLTSGSSNVAVGYAALSNTNGGNNVANGASSLSGNYTGSFNTGIGSNSLKNNDGSNSVALGYYAGAYETGSNSFYVDNQNRTNTAGDKAGALLYGTFNATPASQTLKINAGSVETIGTIELGHATDCTIARVGAGQISVESVVVPTISSTNTLTNKRITKRVVTTTDDATAVIDTDITDVYELTAVANATTFTVTGTPTDGQSLLIRYKDAGAAKGLTFTGFTALGVTIPTTTVISKWGYVGCHWNAGANTWHVIAVGQEV